MNNTKISIIIPVYNVEKYLERCLNSIVNQTLYDLEIICINDGSPDNSLEILERYSKQDKRIKIINQENSGLSVARNTGMEIAVCEYIGFVDSDDWVDSNFYENLYNSAKKYNTDIAVASVLRERIKYSSYRIKYNNEKVYTEKSEIFNACDCPNICYVWNKIYKTEFFKSQNLKFQEGMFFEDILFTTKILGNSKSLVTVPNTYYHYMVNDGTSIVKSNHTLKKNQDRYNNQKEAILFCLENYIKIKEKEYCINNKTYKLGPINWLKIKDNIKTNQHIFLLFGFIPIFKKHF